MKIYYLADEFEIPPDKLEDPFNEFNLLGDRNGLDDYGDYSDYGTNYGD